MLLRKVSYMGEIEPDFVIKIAKEAIKLNLAKESMLYEDKTEKRLHF